MELLGGKLHPGKRDFEDQAFMTGIMSLMPTLMSVPLDEILRGISIAAPVKDALEQREGELGLMLKLTEALELGDAAACHDLVELLVGMDSTSVNACLTQALAWASNIGKEND
jgi:EAL and modified HD-GYP domain-containing signal transduction protein